MTNEDRKAADVYRDYQGDGITVHWEPALCIHVANCIRRLPGVFKPMSRPWVDLSAADADAIAEAVRSCPSGALRYERNDGGPQEPLEEPPAIEARPNGPYFVRGAVRVLDVDGSVLEVGPRAALCRCGGSGNKPFCDGTHREIRFIG